MTKNRSQDRDRPAAAEAAASALPKGSLGAWLRTQREARGVSLRDIADASKISLRYLEAIEQDRLEVLPAPVFTRGFLREYARIVGLDADEVVNLYLLAAGLHDETLPDEEPRAARVAAKPSSGPSPLGYGLLLALAIVLFLAVAALLSWWAERRSARPAAGVETLAGETPSAEALAVPEEPAAAVLQGALDAGPPAAAAEAAIAASVEPAAAAASPAEPPPLRVVLEFTQDCWVELVVDGGRRTGELRASGEVLTLDARESVLLTLGNVSGVRIEVGGRPFALPIGSARVVRDFRIDRELAATLAEPPRSGP